MDEFAIITSTALVSAVILLIVLTKVIRTKKQKEFLKPLFELAIKNNSSISDFDKWNNKVIGIDKNEKNIYYLEKSKIEEKNHTISLEEIQKCKIYDTNRLVKYNNTSQKVVEKLELGILFKDASKPELIIEFFNTKETNFVLTIELQLIQKWFDIINNHIKSKN